MTRRKLVRAVFFLTDAIILVTSLYFAAIIVWQPLNTSPLWQLVITSPLKSSLLLVGIVIAWLMLFAHFGLYRHRYMSFMQYRHYRLLNLVKATSLAALLLVGLAFLAHTGEITTDFIIIFWIINTIATLIAREILLVALREIRLQGRNLRHILIVGTNERAVELSKRIAAQPELGYDLRGFVDDGWLNSKKPYASEVEIVSDLQHIQQYLRSNIVDEVVITLPVATLYNEASRIVKLCEEQGIVSHFVPGFDFLNINSTHLSFETLHDEPIMTLTPPPMKGWQLRAKRTIDIFGAAILITILSPILLLTALAVKVTSPGPVLFVQERVGLNKRCFRLLKFRTMAANAEELQKELEHLNEAGGPVFKIGKDPRITKVGRFLRRTSLDELPQLFNVLIGDMSLVGPRPLPLRDFEGFDQDWHRRRFSVRPGITCIWQISGRSSITFDRWMELDMKYIEKWCLWLDIKILLATPVAVILRRGAV